MEEIASPQTPPVADYEAKAPGVAMNSVPKPPKYVYC